MISLFFGVVLLANRLTGAAYLPSVLGIFAVRGYQSNYQCIPSTAKNLIQSGKKGIVHLLFI